MPDVLRAALDDDRDPVLAWRNHPDVRRSSFTRHVIGVDEHRRWWQTAQGDPARRVLVYEHNGTPAGMVIFSDLDRVRRSAAWGYYLDVAGLRDSGRLLPAWMELERDVVAYAFDELTLDRLGGETLACNEPVLALHRRFGFRELRRYPRLVDGTVQEVVWTELRAADRVAAGTAASTVGGAHAGR